MTIQNSITKLKDELSTIVANMLSQHTLSYPPPKDIALTPNSKQFHDASTLIDGSPNTVESPEKLRKPAHRKSPRIDSTNSSWSTREYDPKDNPGEYRKL